jgi:DNA-binding NarL/FixJ family response regulator
MKKNPHNKCRSLRIIADADRDIQRRGAVAHEVRVFIIDPHSIFRLGMATCLESLAIVGEVTGADSVHDAWQRPELPAADLVIVDAADRDVHAFVRDVRSAYGTPSLACGSAWQVDEMAAVLEAGAAGVLARESLTPETLESNVRAALHGAGVLPSELMARLLGGPDHAVDTGGGLGAGQLNTREQQVLRLIADGHGTREVAAELCYSERTIKNVLHDVVTKLGARSRSHAVAHAVREGLI